MSRVIVSIFGSARECCVVAIVITICIVFVICLVIVSFTAYRIKANKLEVSTSIAKVASFKIEISSDQGRLPNSHSDNTSRA